MVFSKHRLYIRAVEWMKDESEEMGGRTEKRKEQILLGCGK